MTNIEIKCNDCDFVGFENNLEIFADNTEYFKGCPNCKTDEYLVDNITLAKKKDITND